MKIKNTNQYFEYFAEDALSGDDNQSGILEVTSRTATNNSKAIGRLLEVLILRGVIITEDVQYVLGCGEIEIEKP